MSTLMWITTSGLAMSALALTGSLTLVLPEAAFQRLVLPLVALAAGSLLGGALFHMLPESVDALGNDLSLWAWVAGGLFTFFLLEQFLHWHHCHRPVSAHRPIGTLILVADGLHNLIGGLAVGSAFVLDHRVGIVTWVAAAAHEVPRSSATSASWSTAAGTGPGRWASTCCPPSRSSSGASSPTG